MHFLVLCIRFFDLLFLKNWIEFEDRNVLISRCYLVEQDVRLHQSFNGAAYVRFGNAEHLGNFLLPHSDHAVGLPTQEAHKHAELFAGQIRRGDMPEEMLFRDHKVHSCPQSEAHLSRVISYHIR